MDHGSLSDFNVFSDSFLWITITNGSKSDKIKLPNIRQLGFLLLNCWEATKVKYSSQQRKIFVFTIA